jgi:hypothetical protein
MNPELKILFNDEPPYEDMALLLEAIAGEIRQGSIAGSAPEYSWVLSPVQAGIP